MTTFGGTYSTGTVDVTNGSATVPGTGVMWVDVVEGDWLVRAGLAVPILSVNAGFNEITLKRPWPGTTASGATYDIYKMSWLRYDPALTQATLREFLATLADAGLVYYVSGSAPDPDLGEEGQFALKSNSVPWRFWVKTSGVWVEQGAPVGSPGGAITLRYTFSTTTADADPGNGALRLDQATQNTATVIRADLLDRNGATITAILDSFDDSTSTVKGHVRLSKENDDTQFLTGTLSAVASPSGYRNITIAILASSAASPFSNGDNVLLQFTRNGDVGPTGGAGPTGASFAATSTTSLAIGTGSKAFTTQAGLAYTVGARLRAVSASGTSNWMEGLVTAYSGTTLTATMDKTNGSGTKTDWNINIAGEPGAGDLSSANYLSELSGNKPLAVKNLGVGTFNLRNGKVVLSNSAGALTAAIKGLDGNNPSSTNPVTYFLPDGTQVDIVAPVSLVIPSTAKLGADDNLPFALNWSFLYDAGTTYLGVRNGSDASGFYPYPGNGIDTTVTIGVASDDAGVTYTSTGVTAKQQVVIARTEFESTSHTAGTWASNGTRTILYAHGMKQPGDELGSKSFPTTSVSTFTGVGVAAIAPTTLTISYTPQSPISKLSVEADGVLQSNTTDVVAAVQLMRGGAVIGSPRFIYPEAITLAKSTPVYIAATDFPASVSSQTYAVGGFVNNTGTGVFPAGGGIGGGGNITVTERMG